jgi:hypothetical protein
MDGKPIAPGLGSALICRRKNSSTQPRGRSGRKFSSVNERILDVIIRLGFAGFISSGSPRSSMLLEREEGNHSAIPRWCTCIYLHKHTAFIWKKNRHPIGSLYSSCGFGQGTRSFINPGCARCIRFKGWQPGSNRSSRRSRQARGLQDGVRFLGARATFRTRPIALPRRKSNEEDRRCAESADR